MRKSGSARRAAQRALQSLSAKAVEQVSELVSEDWFCRYTAALNSGVYALSEQCLLAEVNYSDIDRLRYFLCQCVSSSDAYWEVMRTILGRPKVGRIQAASVALKDLSFALRKRNMRAAEMAMARLRKTQFLRNLNQAALAFAEGRSSLNAQVKQAKLKEMIARKVNQRNAEAQQIAAQATRSNLTTPEYKTAKGTIRPLPGSYGWRH